MNTARLKSGGRWQISTIVIGVIAISASIFVVVSFAQGAENDAKLLKDAQENFQPLPKDAATAAHPVSPEHVSLGRKFFFDPRISADGTGSCVRCHQPGLYGADGLAKSLGLHDKRLSRNAPTILNVGLQFKAHWDGQFENVEAQATHALLGLGFQNPDDATAIARVKAISGPTFTMVQSAACRKPCGLWARSNSARTFRSKTWMPSLSFWEVSPASYRRIS